MRHRMRLRSRVQVPGMHLLQSHAGLLHDSGQGQTGLRVPMWKRLRMWTELHLPRLHVLQGDVQVLCGCGQAGLPVPLRRGMCVWPGLQVSRLHLLQSGNHRLQMPRLHLLRGIGQMLQDGGSG